MRVFVASTAVCVSFAAAAVSTELLESSRPETNTSDSSLPLRVCSSSRFYRRSPVLALIRTARAPSKRTASPHDPCYCRCFLNIYIQLPPLGVRVPCPAKTRCPAAAALTSSSCGPPGIPDVHEESSPAPSSSRPRSLPGSRSAVSPLKTGGGDSALLNAAILNCEKLRAK